MPALSGSENILQISYGMSGLFPDQKGKNRIMVMESGIKIAEGRCIFG